MTVWHGAASAVLVSALVAGTTAALCVDVIVPTWEDEPNELLWRLCVALALVGLTLWCFVVVVTRSSRAPRLIEEVPACITVKRSTGNRRWCSKCNAPKPDRCHHCSQCGTCVLKMDHHCPWLMDRCIALRNYKSFLLFLLYASALCMYEAYTIVDAFLTLVHRISVLWLVLLSLSLLVRHHSQLLTQFGLALIPFTLFHAYLVSRNRTTLEYMEGMSRVRTAQSNESPDDVRASSELDREAPTPSARLAELLGASGRTSEDTDSEALPLQRPQTQHPASRLASRYNVYDVGMWNNWCQVMGNNVWLWWAPVDAGELNGIRFPVNESIWEMLQQEQRLLESESQPGTSRDAA